MTVLQPFVKLQWEYVQGFVKMNKQYLVSQSYKKGDEPDVSAPKEAILFTDYEDKWLAIAHYNAIKEDKYAYVLDLTKPEHKKKVISILSGGSRYIAYWAAVMNKEALAKQINEMFADNIRQYLKVHTSWSISGKETLYPLIQVIFGELHILFKYRGEELRVKFKDLENT